MNLWEQKMNLRRYYLQTTWLEWFAERRILVAAKNCRWKVHHLALQNVQSHNLMKLGVEKAPGLDEQRTDQTDILTE